MVAKDLKKFDIMNILSIGNRLSGNMETGIPDTETIIDWLDYAS